MLDARLMPLHLPVQTHPQQHLYHLLIIIPHPPQRRNQLIRIQRPHTPNAMPLNLIDQTGIDLVQLMRVLVHVPLVPLDPRNRVEDLNRVLAVPEVHGKSDDVVGELLDEVAVDVAVGLAERADQPAGAVQVQLFEDRVDQVQAVLEQVAGPVVGFRHE